MISIKKLTILCILSVCYLLGQTRIPPYHTQHDFLLTSPGGMGVGLYGYANPALLTYLHQTDILFTWSDQYEDLGRWGLFIAQPHIGFGMIRQNEPASVTDYRLSLASGNRSMSFGIGYGWSSGETRGLERAKVITLGALLRPMPHLSIGFVGNIATSGGGKEGIIDLGIRPLGNELFTLFADYAIQNGEDIKDGHWSIGAALEALPGIRLTGRYFDTEAFTLGFNFSMGRIGVNTQAHYDEEQEHNYTTYGVRIGAYDRNIVGRFLQRKKKYIRLDLKGPLKYQRYKLFDKSNTLAELISIIDAAKKDETIDGIAINASGMEINKEMAWELREKLEDFESAGKHVVIYIDYVGMTGYHLASIANTIVMHPLGSIDVKGFIAGHTYLKGTLEKLGIGFEELRLLKYKSAAEALSRENMSEADREQRQKLIDDFYRLAKSDICDNRNMTPEEFDYLVNEEFLFIAHDALEKDLVDTLGCWEAVERVIETLEGDDVVLINPGSIATYQLPRDDYWGEKPQIAVIYALGICAMDEWMNARKLVKDIEAAAKNPKIKAVVFRVDCTGGVGIAPDVVAEVLKKCREKKPVIVSQGFVAASGGYWISIYGDTIVAAPNTITGSIGILNPWFYNKGFKEKLGMSTDFVKVGDHADFGFGIPLPFIGMRLPDRNLTEEEYAKIEYGIKSAYKEFVTKVTEGRNKEYDEIESIAQGRAWSGLDGKRIGLVDVLGGLETAIQIAKEKAGIPKEQEVTIVELPEKGLINPEILSKFTPSLFGFTYQEDKFVEYLKFLVKHNGEPLPILPMEYMEIILMNDSY